MDRVDLLNRIAELEAWLSGMEIDSRDIGIRRINSRVCHLGVQWLEDATDERLAAFLEHLESVKNANAQMELWG